MSTQEIENTLAQEHMLYNENTFYDEFTNYY